MDLSFRLGLLKDGGQIDQETYEKLLKVPGIVKDRWGIELLEENGAMLITHMAAALMRVKRGEPVNPIEEEIIIQLRTEKDYASSQHLLKALEEELEIALPEEEKEFIIMHLCTLRAA